MNIMLVEYSPTDRLVVHTKLHRAFPDARFWVAGEACELDEYLKQESCDAIITDYWLGWSDGLSVLQRVRKRWPRCKVIMLTGNGGEEIVARALKFGLFQYLLKPYGMEELIAVARAALESKRREDELELLGAIFESIDDGVFSVDRAGVITSWNRSAERIFAFPADEIVGQRLDVLLPPSLGAETERLHELVLAGKTVPALEMVRLRRDGSAARLTITLAPIRTNGRGIEGIACVARANRHADAETRDTPAQPHADPVGD